MNWTIRPWRTPMTGIAGFLETIQVISTLPGDFTDTSYCADIHVSPDGRFVYGSNRGHDSIVIFEVDSGTGRLSVLDYESTRGEFPRNFALDPSGRFPVRCQSEYGQRRHVPDRCANWPAHGNRTSGGDAAAGLYQHDPGGLEIADRPAVRQKDIVESKTG